ncbi:hypothetical protein [Bifidobacterium simiarum]|nr:hypothetical protein [Bifidobacterium simiarum]MBT1167204.1 hypothetical protein [Bifidobacterium simiarum]
MSQANEPTSGLLDAYDMARMIGMDETCMKKARTGRAWWWLRTASIR